MSRKQNQESVLLTDGKYLNSFQVERRNNLKASRQKNIFTNKGKAAESFLRKQNGLLVLHKVRKRIRKSFVV